MRRFYRIAGLNFCVSAPEGEGYEEDGLLASFQTEPTAQYREIRLCLQERLDPPEGEAWVTADGLRVYRQEQGLVCYYGCYDGDWETGYLRLARNQHDTCAQLRRENARFCLSPGIALEAMELQHHLVQHGGFLLHASYIDVNGEAILFSAPSGTGKSTQASLWCDLRGAELINGDRAAVMLGETGACACGVPYSGSSQVRKNVTRPLKAVVVLSQAQETTIHRMEGMAAFRKIWEGCSVNTWDPADMNLCAQAVMDMLRHVPVYHLACTPDESAVRILEEALGK